MQEKERVRIVKGGEIKKSVFLGLFIAFTIADSRASVLEIEKADHSSSSSCAHILAAFPVSLP